jgi:hypothetical protein
MEAHPDGYDKIKFDDPEFQKRLRIQETKFGYGVMSMEDVELTDAATSPDQDERDMAGTIALLHGKGL